MYLESGSVVNTADLWKAFWTVVSGAADETEEEEEEEEEETKRVLALFETGLAELKFLGMVKGSRKKADHLQKSAWRGL